MKKWKRGVLLAALAAVCLGGCGSKEPEGPPQTENVIAIGGVEIHPGQTRLLELEEAGMAVSFDKNLAEPIPEDLVMEPRSYSAGLFFGKDGMAYGVTKFLNSEEEEKPLMDSIINQVEFYYAENPDPNSLPYYHENVTINGVDLHGMNGEEVRAAFEGQGEDWDQTDYPDGTIYFWQFSMDHCFVTVEFGMDTGTVTKAKIEMFTSNF